MCKLNARKTSDTSSLFVFFFSKQGTIMITLFAFSLDSFPDKGTTVRAMFNLFLQDYITKTLSYHLSMFKKNSICQIHDLRIFEQKPSSQAYTIERETKLLKPISGGPGFRCKLWLCKCAIIQKLDNSIFLNRKPAMSNLIEYLTWSWEYSKDSKNGI